MTSTPNGVIRYTNSLTMAQPSLTPVPSSSFPDVKDANWSALHSLLDHYYDHCNHTVTTDYYYYYYDYYFNDCLSEFIDKTMDNTTEYLSLIDATGRLPPHHSFLEGLNEDDKLPDPLPWNIRITFAVLYAIIIILAIAGNFLVIAVIARTPAMRTVTNTFLVSLAVSDLCIASINMPFQLKFYLHNEWTLGAGLCKFSKYLQGVVIVASIFTLTGIAIDRYYAIMHPLRARNVHTSRRAVLILSLFWLLSFGLLLPQVFIQRLELLIKVQPEVIDKPIRIANVCVEYFASPAYNIAYTIFFYFALYLAPVLIMSVTYGILARKLWKRRRIGETPDEEGRRLREKKRIVRMLVVIVITFSVSWFPFFTCHLYQLFMPLGRQFRVTMAILQLIGYSNSCINPFIYCFMNDKFQRAVLSTLCCKCFARKLTNRRPSSHTYVGSAHQTTNSMLLENKSVVDSPSRRTTFV